MKKLLCILASLCLMFGAFSKAKDAELAAVRERLKELEGK